MASDGRPRGRHVGLKPGQDAALKTGRSARARRRLVAIGGVTLLLLGVSSSSAAAYELSRFETFYQTDPTDIASDHQGGAWFANIAFHGGLGDPYNYGHIAANGTITEYPFPPNVEQSRGVTVAADGTVWLVFHEHRSEGKTVVEQERILRRLPGGTTASFPLPSEGSEYYSRDLTEGSDGNIWFLPFQGTALVRITPKGEETAFPISNPNPPSVTAEFAIASGPDGALWFTQYDYQNHQASIQRMTTGGQVTVFPIIGSEPIGITAGPDGALWFTQPSDHRIGRMSVNGTASFFSVGSEEPWAITAGQDGALWFGQEKGARLGRITTSGAITYVPLSPSFVAGRSMTASGNTALWVTTPGNVIGEVTGVERTGSTGEYVALGDSFSSGEGNPPYDPATDQVPGNTCHRSEVAAYGPLLDQQLGLGPMIFRACSGAVTDDFFHNNHSDGEEPAQLRWLGASTTTVTLTIGGDDGGFAKLLEHCVAASGPLERTLPFHGFGCSKDRKLRGEVSKRLQALSGTATDTTPQGLPIHTIGSVIDEVHAKASSARVVIGGYPHLFGPSASAYQDYSAAPSKRACLVGFTEIHGYPTALLVDYKDAQWLNSLGNKLDKIIKRAVDVVHRKRVAVAYANPEAFTGHGFCDAKARWFNEVELNSANEPQQSSFHPTKSGQAEGYEPAFAAQLR